MQLILREPVQNLGVIGDLVNVKAGYARNFLLPYGKAVSATADNIKDMQARKAEFEAAAAMVKAAAETLKSSVEGKTFVITANVGDEGKLYGSIGAADIIETLAAQGVTIEKAAVRLPEGPLHSAGEHAVGLHLHTEVNANIMIDIQAQED